MECSKAKRLWTVAAREASHLSELAQVAVEEAAQASDGISVVRALPEMRAARIPCKWVLLKSYRSSDELLAEREDLRPKNARATHLTAARRRTQRSRKAEDIAHDAESAIEAAF